MMGRTMEITCLTRNTNIRSEEPARRKGKKLTSQEPTMKANDKPSLFNKVLKRRASRQSIKAPTNIDFNYAGDSAVTQHLFERRPDGQGFANNTQLNFELNLRNYKNTTEWLAAKPFQFPAVRDFSPRKQWRERKMDHMLINAEYKKKFNDQFAVKNANELIHQFDKLGLNCTA